VEKGRFFVFIVVALAIWLSYVGLQLWLAPQPRPLANKPADVKKLDAEKATDDTAASADNGDGGSASAVVDSPSSSEGTDTVEVPSTTSPKTVAGAPPKRLTLGSADPNGPYKMLVTLDSRGAAIERVELSSDRYCDLEDKGGYLGQLALSDSEDGVRVNVVGPGTPAALAKPLGGNADIGLQTDDVIESIAGTAVVSVKEVADVLKATRPKQTIELEIGRKVDGESRTLRFETTLGRRPLEMIRPEQPQNELPGGKVELGRFSPPSMLMTFETLGSKTLKVQETEFKNLPSLLTSSWKVEDQGEDFVAFSLEIDAPPAEAGGEPTPIKVIKKYTLKKFEANSDPGYDLDLEIEIQNRSKEKKQVAYRLDGVNGLPLEGWWYSVKLHPEMFKGAGARDVVWRTAGQPYHLLGCPEVVSDARAAIKEDKPVELGLLTSGKPEAIDFAGIDCQFFSGVVMPQSPDAEKPLLFSRLTALPLQDVAKLDKARTKTCNSTVRMVTQAQTLEPDEKLTHNYRIFLGPKDPVILDQYKIGALIEYGWFYAAWPAQILRRVLEFLHYIVGNWGISIILLTLFVRGCMVPFSLKQAKSAALMQQLAPEMAALKEKYADDMEKQGKAMRELYAKYNFNPFGGCLLLLFQLPVFVGLYRCLSVDIELRDASLIPGLSWASNLAGPDMLWYWKPYLWPMIADEAHGWLGPYFNVLPLFTISLFILQQKLFTPPATDEQTKMQQKMMTYMTVFMGIMFYKVPAGLCLYFITSSLWSVIERKLITKPKPPGTAGANTITSTATPAKPSGNGSTSFKQAKKLKNKRR
jgi:YidC/Oxa1 family membrane protein insertase